MTADIDFTGSDLDAGAVWQRYGLEDDPFFTNFLDSQAGVRYGIHLFRGEARRTQAQKAIRGIMNTGSSLRLIEGPIGCGKTTLASYIKSELHGHDGVAVFPGRVHIDMMHDNAVQALMAGILDAAIDALAEASPDAYTEARQAGKGLVIDELIELRGGEIGLDRILTLKRVHQQTLRQSEHRPLRHWFYALESVAAGARASGIERIVIHINNVEQSVQRDATATAALFGDVRDVFQLEGYHFILCAAPEFRTKVLTQRPNVTDILSVMPVPPLTRKEVEQIIEARYEHFNAPGKGLCPPMQPAHFADLCEVFGGDMRGALQTANQAFVEELRPSRTPVQLDASQVIDLVRPQVESRMAQLTDLSFSLLRAIVELDDGEGVRQADVLKALQEAGMDAKQSAVSQIAEALANDRWISIRRPHAKASFYHPIGRTLIVQDLLREA